MKPRISVLTLAVAELERSLAFYRDGLGLPTEGIIGREYEHGAVAFFELNDGLKLAIWGQDDLVYDSGLAKAPVSSTAVSIGHNVATCEEVDQVMDQARRAGADIVKPARETFFGGYGGYFRDPDGHLGRSCGTRRTFRRTERNAAHGMNSNFSSRTHCFTRLGSSNSVRAIQHSSNTEQ
jgi:uncharacterized protein